MQALNYYRRLLRALMALFCSATGPGWDAGVKACATTTPQEGLSAKAHGETLELQHHRGENRC
jgi:hypothetical protein